MVNIGFGYEVETKKMVKTDTNINTEELTAKQWEKNFWSAFHSTCLKCIHECKQSAQILGITCIKFSREDSNG